MNYNNIGDMLRNYRIKNAMSVAQVTDELEKKFYIRISRKTLYAWENNQNQPSASCFLALCEIYNIENVLKTFGYESKKESTPLILNHEERELIIKYRSRKYPNSAIRKLLDIE